MYYSYVKVFDATDKNEQAYNTFMLSTSATLTLINLTFLVLAWYRRKRILTVKDKDK